MNPKINLHTHSTFCDGQNTLEEMVISAISKNFTVLGFSGHCLYPLTSDFYVPEDENWHMSMDGINQYIAEIKRLKQKYSSQIEIYQGFEADFFEGKNLINAATGKLIGNAVPDKAAYEALHPDFLIGAVHFVTTEKGFYTVDHKTEVIRQSLEKLYKNPVTGKIDAKAAVCDYFEAQRQMLKKGNFDIWAHADLMRKRNGQLKLFDENETWYKDELKATIKAAKGTGVVAEINTGAIARGAMNDFYPSEYFLQLMFDAGIPICINSDCHNAPDLDCAFEEAAERAKKTGYRELVYPVAGIQKIVKL